MVSITTQAPARVDLAGGTLDIWPLYLFHENSQTVNFAIDCYARCLISGRPGGRDDKRIVVRSRDPQKLAAAKAAVEAMLAKVHEGLRKTA